MSPGTRLIATYNLFRFLKNVSLKLFRLWGGSEFSSECYNRKPFIHIFLHAFVRINPFYSVVFSISTPRTHTRQGSSRCPRLINI
jgi:hypothetical protein